MGAIAEGIVAYAQPLIDQTDGSVEDLNKALTLSQLCWNMSLLPENKRDQMLSEIRPSLQMDDAEFDEFRHSIIEPMIQRHQEMFPSMHRRGVAASSQSRALPQAQSRAAASSPNIALPRAQSRAVAGEAYPGTGPYAPCPCNSGRKYKFCCRTKGR